MHFPLHALSRRFNSVIYSYWHLPFVFFKQTRTYLARYLQIVGYSFTFLYQHIVFLLFEYTLVVGAGQNHDACLPHLSNVSQWINFLVTHSPSPLPLSPFFVRDAGTTDLLI